MPHAGDQTETLTHIVTEIIHRKPAVKIFWHLDDRYLATTSHFHQIELLASPGEHTITAVDEYGNSIRCRFSVTGG